MSYVLKPLGDDQKFIVPLSSRVPPPCTLSLTMPVVTCSSVNICQGGDKKGEIMVKILAAPSVRQNTDYRVMYGRKGVKNVLKPLTRG